MAKSRINNILILVEVVLTIGSTLVFLKIEHHELAILAGVLGSLITTMTYAIPFNIKCYLQENISNADSFVKIFKLLSTIDKHEELKENIIDRCLRDLDSLSRNIVLGDIYYKWLYAETKKCRKSIKAISSMNCECWELHEENMYYNANREARLRKDVKVERIFILSRNSIQNELNRKILLKHIIDEMDTFILFSDQLSDFRMDGIKKGMTIFDDKLIFVDVVLPPENAGGRLIEKAREPEEFRIKKEDYERIRPADCITSIERLSEIICVDKIELLGEACEILKERHGNLEALERRRESDKNDACIVHDYNRWKEYINVVPSAGDNLE